ncbi:amidase domain-containing protein, partial [Paenibacillus chibensis]
MKVKKNTFVRKASTAALAIMISVITVTPVFAQDNDIQGPEKIIQGYLKEHNLNFPLGSEDYHTFLLNIKWNEIDELKSNPNYDEIRNYAIQYEDESSFGKKNSELESLEYKMLLENSKDISEYEPKASTLQTSYNRQVAVNYALNWATNGGKSRNPSYEDYSNDCTNFASQVWFAGGNNMRKPTSIPSGWNENTAYWYFVTQLSQSK